MEDWEEESPSDEEDRSKIENELYSMFYYHSVKDGIPQDLAEKYNVDVEGSGVTVSLVGAAEAVRGGTESGDPAATHPSPGGRYIDGRKGSQDVEDRTQIELDNSAKDRIAEGDPPTTPRPLPRPQHPGNISRFQSMRYFSQTIKSDFKSKYQNFKANRERKSLHDHSTSDPQDASPSPRITLSTSTPLTKRNAGVDRQNRKNEVKKIVNARSISKDAVIDLTEGSPGGNRKRKKGNRVEPTIITVSSESEEEDSLEVSSSESEGWSGECFESLVLNTSSGSRRADKLVLNTLNDSSRADGELVINTDYNWKETSSPQGWTSAMRRFYNKPSRSLLNLDCSAALLSVREGGDGWWVCREDRARGRGAGRGRAKRCRRCQQDGHLAAQCSRVLTCHMCGNPGHPAAKCPHRICLKCGRASREAFPRGCAACADDAAQVCSHCRVPGHSDATCTAAWRVPATQPAAHANKSRLDEARPKYCCNCAKRGHLYEQCKQVDISFALGDRQSRKRRPVKRKVFDNVDKHLNYNQKHLNYKAKGNIRFGSNLLRPQRKMKMKGRLRRDGVTQRDGVTPSARHPRSKRILMLRKSNRKNKS